MESKVNRGVLLDALKDLTVSNKRPTSRSTNDSKAYLDLLEQYKQQEQKIVDISEEKTILTQTYLQIIQSNEEYFQEISKLKEENQELVQRLLTRPENRISSRNDNLNKTVMNLARILEQLKEKIHQQPLTYRTRLENILEELSINTPEEYPSAIELSFEERYISLLKNIEGEISTGRILVSNKPNVTEFINKYGLDQFFDRENPTLLSSSHSEYFPGYFTVYHFTYEQDERMAIFGVYGLFPNRDDKKMIQIEKNINVIANALSRDIRGAIKSLELYQEAERLVQNVTL